MATAARPAWQQSWEMRLVARLPLHPALSGLLFATLLVLVYAVLEFLLGGSDAHSGTARSLAGLTDDQIGYGIAALASGYVLAAGYLINDENVAAVGELGSLLGPSASQLRNLPGVSLNTSRVWGSLGLLAGLLCAYNVDEAVADLVSRQVLTGDALSSIVALVLAFWLSTRAAYFTIAGTRAVSRAVERGRAPDLLEPDPLASLGRMALRGAVLWIGAAAVASLSVWLTAGSAAEFASISFLLLVAAGTFVIPVHGVRRRIRHAKRCELEAVRAEIRRDRETLRELGADASSAAQRLPGLLAYEARIEAAREWPFDTSTVLRFFLYLSIPLASWLGGALVERLVDRLLA